MIKFEIVGRSENELQKPKYFIVKTAEGICATAHHDILYVEYYRHRLTCHLTSGERVESLSMRGSCGELTAALTDGGDFLRISASHVINMRYVRRFTSRIFELTDGKRLNLSRVYADARAKYLSYVGK